MNIKNKLEKAIITGKIRTARVAGRATEFARKKEDGVDAVVISLIILVVGIAAAMLYKTNVLGVITDQMSSIKTQIADMMK